LGRNSLTVSTVTQRVPAAYPVRRVHLASRWGITEICFRLQREPDPCHRRVRSTRYIDKGPTALNNKVIHEALQRLVPERTEQIMGWLTQPYFDKGKAEGEAKILTRLLERRFGTLPDPLRHRILAADAGSIETWVERAFDAPDLQSIFDSN
jgi:Domain of unknown function (DUF4351)